MNIIYMGTPDFAVPALEKLFNTDNNICAVVSQQDTAKDRGKKIKPTPVKAKALELGIDVLQPEKIKGNIEFFNKLKSYKPDLIVVAAYGRLITKEILELPTYGCVNIHGSILPKWRGAAPIQWSIVSGDKETGVTLMQMSEGLDTGDMLAVSKTPIERKTAGELHVEIAEMGANLLIDNLENIKNGTINRIKQDDKLSCYAKMISKKDGLIDFSKSAMEIENMVRGFNPWPATFTYMDEKMLKIWEADVLEEESGKEPGTIFNVSEDGIKIATGKGTLLATKIQVPGKKRVEVRDFIRGNSIELFSKLG